jgi:hypothetical protein
MASTTTFETGTVITSDWLNQVDEFILGADSFGAAGDGTTDDTAEILAAATSAVTNNMPLRLLPGCEYKFSQLSLPDNLVLLMEGASLKSDSSLTTAGDITLTLGANTKVDNLKITTAGTETNTDILSIGDNSWIGMLDVRSTAQRAGGGVITQGQGVTILDSYFYNIDRPFHVNNTDDVTPTTGFVLGRLRCHSYVRAYRGTHAYNSTLGVIYATGASANSSMSAGHNAVLIDGCSNFTLDTLYSEDAGEHAFRIGGSANGGVSDNWHVGKIVAVRPGGCAFKVNPTETALGVTEKASGWSVGSIIGIDVGDNSAAGNKELLRLSHVRNWSIGEAYAIKDAATFSGQYGLIINDSNNGRIGSLGGDMFNAGFISLDYTSDIDGTTVADDVLGLQIDNMYGTCNSATNAIGITMDSFDYGDIVIKNINITGFTTNLIRFISGTLSGSVHLSGVVTGAVAPTVQSAPTSANVVVDIFHNRSVFRGRADGLRWDATAQQFTVPSFAATDVVPKGVYINCTEGTAASGAFGGALEFSRVGSGRRAAAIAVKQMTATAQNTGLVFYVGGGTSSSDLITDALQLTHERALGIPDGITAPTTLSGYAQLYVDSADGDLKVKFSDGTVKTISVDT